jgi:hypothetical protein
MSLILILAAKAAEIFEKELIRDQAVAIFWRK